MQEAIRVVIFAVCFVFLGTLGIVCTFYPRWLQRLMTDDRYGSFLDPLYFIFTKRLIQTRYFVWQTIASGLIALLAAAVLLFGLVHELVHLLPFGR